MAEPKAVEPDPLPPGYRIGTRYIIESELPQARMGRVYKAQDPILNRTVAINVLAPAFRDDDNLGRFFQCFRTAFEERQRAGISNPILDVFSIDGTVGVVVAYIPGIGAALDIAEP
ncbi:MAG TPA: hypothetical protein VN375_00860 [Vicinamibacteria bacterium]|nr:hypothetical protein [Vicinamibacteria bacterium]